MAGNIDGFSSDLGIIPTSDVDPDSPVNTTLITKLRDQIEFIQRWMGKGGIDNAVANHAHAGFAIDGTAAIAGSSGGVGIAVGHALPNSLDFSTNICNFEPEVLIATDITTTGDVYIKLDTDATNNAHNMTDNTYGTEPGIRDISSTGCTLNAGASTLANRNNMLGFLALKTLSGILKIDTYTGNATDNTGITSVGFQPDMVWIQSEGTGSRAMFFRTQGFTGNNSATFNQVGVLTDGIKSFDADGFTIGTNVNVNTNAELYRYMAFKSGSSEGEKINIQSYTGTGSTGRLLTNDASFNAQWVMITRTDATNANRMFSWSRNQAKPKITNTGTFQAYATVIERFAENSIILGNGEANVNTVAYDIIWIGGGTRP